MMIALAATLAAFGAVLGLHLESPVELEPADAARIGEVLARSLETKSGRRIITDDPVWAAACTARDRCLEEIRARLRTGDVVLVKMFGGPISIRVVIELAGARSATTESRIPRDPSAWAAHFDRAAEQLFPLGAERDEPPIRAAPPPPIIAPEEGSPAPWIILGGSALAAGAGLLFGANSGSIERELQNGGVTTGARFREREGAMQDNARAANICFTVALAGGVTGTLWLLLE